MAMANSKKKTTKKKATKKTAAKKTTKKAPARAAATTPPKTKSKSKNMSKFWKIALWTILGIALAGGLLWIGATFLGNGGGSGASSEPIDPVAQSSVTPTNPADTSSTPPAPASVDNPGDVSHIIGNGNVVITGSNSGAITLYTGYPVDERQIALMEQYRTKYEIAPGDITQALEWWSARTEVIAAMTEAESNGNLEEFNRLQGQLYLLDHPYITSWDYFVTKNIFGAKPHGSPEEVQNNSGQPGLYFSYVPNSTQTRKALSWGQLHARAALYSNENGVQYGGLTYLKYVLWPQFEGSVYEWALGDGPHNTRFRLP